eukprot:TRINITY_DN799_c0_g1_i1.p1 TRINITY_DN799_c0_g1~~TRINITY_DN799_c0_g1_i1.p1  ORF type:complete len:545 (+),score=109.56 TRINITY_DN799_c0_g1_i1:1419-3053(+)
MWDEKVIATPAWVCRIIHQKLPAVFMKQALVEVSTLVQTMVDERTAAAAAAAAPAPAAAVDPFGWDDSAGEMNQNFQHNHDVSTANLMLPTSPLNKNSLALSGAISNAINEWFQIAIIFSHAFTVIDVLDVDWLIATTKEGDPISKIEELLATPRQTLKQSVPSPRLHAAYGSMFRLTKSQKDNTSSYLHFHRFVSDAVNLKTFKPGFEIPALTAYLIELYQTSASRRIVALPSDGRGRVVAPAPPRASANHNNNTGKFVLTATSGIQWIKRDSFSVSVYYGVAQKLKDEADRILGVLSYAPDAVSSASLLIRAASAQGGIGAAEKLRSGLPGTLKLVLVPKHYITEEQAVDVGASMKALFGVGVGDDILPSQTLEDFVFTMLSRFKQSNKDRILHLYLFITQPDRDLITLARDVGFASITLVRGSPISDDALQALLPPPKAPLSRERSEWDDIDEENGFGVDMMDIDDLVHDGAESGEALDTPSDQPTSTRTRPYKGAGKAKELRLSLSKNVAAAPDAPPFKNRGTPTSKTSSSRDYVMGLED